MNPKLSCLPVSLYPEFYGGTRTIPQWAAEASALGLDMVDINALFLREKSEEQIRTIRQELTVPVLAHRIILRGVSYQNDSQGFLEQLLQQLPAPTETLA